ncbi:Hypothetical predicted protein [Marmota monax]|uniref:Uncharacterized protein n=1 Tax=Marmota monax TaxID=9995 RepID=A0A5E4B2F3_MARMO|nr:hypothetical protein GHT09_000064 [Marmota monax]VTJ63897.1 Hypothetical predicted protein [Marmota monax]
MRRNSETLGTLKLNDKVCPSLFLPARTRKLGIRRNTLKATHVRKPIPSGFPQAGGWVGEQPRVGGTAPLAAGTATDKNSLIGGTHI